MAPPPPPPPPPGPGAGRAPGPPPPPGPPAGAAQAFRIVPGLGEALHGAMKKISGVEEIAPAAEGVASESTRHTSTPTGAARPRSWHGTQVPGKPKISRPLMSEMENRLARRRDKVDAEAYVSEGPDPVALPPEPACLPPSGAHRKPSTASVDSGRGSLEPGLTSRSSLEPGGYARVTVDQERKEELMLAKAVRRSSAKMLSRDPSPSLCSPAESPETVKEATPDQGSLQPASQVVLRYWQQCSSTADSGYFGEEGISMEDAAKDSNGDVVPPWRSEAIEGEEQDFPSIAAKIKQMEEEAKRPLAMYEVPDVKSKMKTGAPAAKWMEARKLMLVNSYFVNDIKGYSRKEKGLPEIAPYADAHFANMQQTSSSMRPMSWHGMDNELPQIIVDSEVHEPSDNYIEEKYPAAIAEDTITKDDKILQKYLHC